jgi:hypothetical protein
MYWIFFFTGGSENIHEFTSVKLLAKLLSFERTEATFIFSAKYRLPTGFGKKFAVRSEESEKYRFRVTLPCSVETRGNALASLTTT